MGYNKQHCENLASLKRCNRIFGITGTFYLIFCGLYAIDAIFMIVISVGGVIWRYFFDGVVFKAAILASGYYGCYTKNNFYTILTPFLCILNSIIFLDMPLNTPLVSASIILAVLTVFANNKYKILEQCEGFPYFNERIDAQNELFENPKDIYKEQYENIVKNSSDKMDEL